MVSEPATMARIEFDAMTLCRDAVPSDLDASSYTVHQYQIRPCCDVNETHKVKEEILAINYELSRSLLRLFHDKRPKGSCVIYKQWSFP
jgi:hypothetical protein